MDSKLYQFFSTFLFLSITLNSPALTAGQECPYPCYPPPISGGGGGGGGGSSGNTPPAVTMPPPSQSGSYPPPASTYNPPSGVFPYNPPAPDFYGGVPPPPDPIVPWFPYYYRKPPHNPNYSSATALQGRPTMVVIFLFHLLISPLLFLVL